MDEILTELKALREEVAALRLQISTQSPQFIPYPVAPFPTYPYPLYPIVTCQATGTQVSTTTI